MGVPNTVPMPEVLQHDWRQVTIQKAHVVPGQVDQNGDPVFFVDGEAEVKVMCWQCQVGLNHPSITQTACNGNREEVDEDGQPVYDEDDGDELGNG